MKRREKENKAVVVPPEKRGMKKERKKEREKSEKNRKGVVHIPKRGHDILYDQATNSKGEFLSNGDGLVRLEEHHTLPLIT